MRWTGRSGEWSDCVDVDTGAGVKEALSVASASGCCGVGSLDCATAMPMPTARQPEAEGKISSSLMLGLVFIETAIIYALIVAILINFVL